MKTTFVRKPSTLREMLSDRDRIRGGRGGQDTDSYYITAEKHLTASEWSDLTNNFLTDRNWIADFSAQKHLPDGDKVACLRVTGDGSQIILLIDPSGYNYARYVGVESVPESRPQRVPAERPSEPSPKEPAPRKNTIVIKVWRGLVSEVYASNPDTQIIIIDEDAGDEAPTDLPEYQVY